MSTRLTSGSSFSEPVSGITIRRFSVDEYHRLADAGILTEDDRVELLEGLVSPKMIHSPIHDATVSVVEHVLRPLLLSGWMLRIQSAITLETSEPEPDIVVAKGPPQRYVDRHPQGPDVGLVIEVAESSLNRDRMKANTYAAGEVPEYWIVNLKDRTLELLSTSVASP
jgi:Uma2 family endonuclease